MVTQPVANAKCAKPAIHAGKQVLQSHEGRKGDQKSRKRCCTGRRSSSRFSTGVGRRGRGSLSRSLASPGASVDAVGGGGRLSLSLSRSLAVAVVGGGSTGN